MATSSQVDLAAYMSNSIRTIMAKAYKSVLSNPREAKFAYRMQTLFQKSEKRRRKMLEQEGMEVPPFLISSISTTCNLHCKGCYARSNGIAEDVAANQKATLAPEQWQAIFTEAADMGINFSLIAGGEPFMRKDILEKIAEVKDMFFPIMFQAAVQVGYEPAPFLLALMIAANASYSTPIAASPNMLVYGPGGYRFTDFMRIGIPLTILVTVTGVVAVILTCPLVKM